MREQITQAIAEAKTNRFHVLMMAMAMFVILTEGYDLVIYGSIKSQLIAEWGMSQVTAGLIGSVALVGMMVGSFTLGLLADILGRKRVLIFCVALFSLSTGLAGFMHGPISFSIFRFLAGLGIGGAMPNAIGLLSDYIPKHSKSTLIATAMAGIQVGGILAPLLCIATGDSGWRICLWVAFLPLLMIPVMVRWLPNSIDYALAHQEYAMLQKNVLKAAPLFKGEISAATCAALPQAEEKSPVAELFVQGRARNTVLCWLAFFMGLLMIYGLNTWLPELMQAAGYNLGSSLTFLLALNVAALFGSFILGMVADRTNIKRLLVILYLVGVVSMMLLSIKSNIVVAYILISICGVCVNGPQNVGTSFVASNYPSHVRSTGLGVCNTVGRLGGILGPTLGGFLMSAALPMFFNCLAFAIPGLIAAGAYGFCRQNKSKA